MKKYKMMLMLDSFDEALDEFCSIKPCKTCPLRKGDNGTGYDCDDFCKKYPEKAAELMGLETIEEIDEDCGLKTRSLVIDEMP